MTKKKAESSRDLGKAEKEKKKKKKKEKHGKPPSQKSLISSDSKVKKKKSSSNLGDPDKKKKKKKKVKKAIDHLVSDGGPAEGEHSAPKERATTGQDTAEYEATAAEASAHTIGRKSTTGEDTGGGDSLLEESQRERGYGGSEDEDLDEADDDIGDLISGHDMDYMDADMDHMMDSQIIDTGPPIGEILAVPTEDDNVSEIGEVIQEEMKQEIIDGVQIIYNPDDTDVCFDDRGHPGTKDWILVIRECLEKFEGQDYSPPVYKAIKKKLKGRRFLVRSRRDERTSWREATKPEVIEIFGDCFNEERRRIAEGITDDDSGVDSSLLNSVIEEDSLLEMEYRPDGMNGAHAENDHTGTASPTNYPSEVENAMEIEFNFHSPRRSNSDGAMAKLKADMRNQSKPSKSFSNAEVSSQQHLLVAMREIEAAEEYAKPFDKVTLMREGIAAEEKLKTLLGLADSSKTLALKTELDRLEDLAERMKYASMAPLLETLVKIEGRMTDYFQSLSDDHKDSHSLRQSISRLKQMQNNIGGSNGDFAKPALKGQRSMDRSPVSPVRRLEDDPDTDPEHSLSRHKEHSNQGGRQRRSIPVGSDHGPPADRRKSQNDLAASQDLDSKEEEVEVQDFADDVSGSNGEVDNADSMDLPSDREEELNDVSATGKKEASMRVLDLADSSDKKEGGSKNKKESYFGQDESYGSADLGGSFREEALGGSFGTAGLSGELSDLGEDDEDDEDDESIASEDSEEYEEDDDSEEEDEDDDDDEEYDEDEDEEHEGSLQDEPVEKEAPEEGGNESIGAMGRVLALSSTPDDDDLSSVGRSLPDMYGSESELEDDGDYSQYDMEASDLSDEDDYGSESSSDNEPSPIKKRKDDAAPNPKLEQFFDRLQHFFEVRRKVEERADLMDPSMKLRTLKLKQHSGGIMKKNGNFKKEYQQRDLRKKLVRTLDDLYDTAEVALEEFRITLNLMAAEIKGMEEKNITIAPLKPRDRAFEKSQEEYGDRDPGPPESWLYDIVRGSVVCKSYKQIADVNKWIGQNCTIVSSKNRFKDPCFNGYRDLLFHVSIPFRDGQAHICEIQVHHKELKTLDDQFGMPKHYEFFRSSFAGPWRTQQQVLDDLSMLNRYGEIGGQCMLKLLKSKDPDQLRLFAKLCHDKLSEDDRALELYRKILRLQEATKGNDHEDVASTYLSIGLVLGSLGEINESLRNLQKALEIKESLLGTDHVEVADVYSEVGHMLIQKGDYDGAMKRYKSALKIRESKLGREHFLVINSLHDIGGVLRQKGDFRAAETELRRALKIQEAVLDDTHPDVAVTHAKIGEILCDLGDFGKAMESHRIALSVRETTLGKNHQKTAESHTDIGIVLYHRGDYEVAEWRHRKALRIREAVRGKDDEECAVSLSHLGEVLIRKGDLDEAIKELTRAVTIRENNLGMDHPITAGAYLNLGQVFLRKRKFDQALHEFRRAKVVRESILGQQHPDTAIAYNAVGNALSQSGDHDGAIEEHKKALKIYETTLGKSHPKTANGHQNLADSLLQKGDNDEALIEHRKALAIRANVLAKDHPDTALSCARIGSLLAGKGDLVGALVAYRQALAIVVALCGENHPDVAAARIRVGGILAAQGDFDEALDEMEQGLAIRETALGKDHPETGKASSFLGTVHNIAGDYSSAQTYHKKAVAILEKKLGKKSSVVKAAREGLSKSSESQGESTDKLLEFY